jgi:hypothetical protein
MLSTQHPCSTGTQCSSLSQGVYEAAGRRYVLVWKMLNEVMIISMVPSGCSTLTAHRLNGAVAQLLLIYCKSTTAVTMDRIFRKYVQVCAPPHPVVLLSRIHVSSNNVLLLSEPRGFGRCVW